MISLCMSMEDLLTHKPAILVQFIDSIVIPINGRLFFHKNKKINLHAREVLLVWFCFKASYGFSEGQMERRL